MDAIWPITLNVPPLTPPGAVHEQFDDFLRQRCLGGSLLVHVAAKRSRDEFIKLAVTRHPKLHIHSQISMICNDAKFGDSWNLIPYVLWYSYLYVFCCFPYWTYHSSNRSVYHQDPIFSVLLVVRLASRIHREHLETLANGIPRMGTVTGPLSYSTPILLWIYYDISW